MKTHSLKISVTLALLSLLGCSDSPETSPTEIPEGVVEITPPTTGESLNNPASAPSPATQNDDSILGTLSTKDQVAPADALELTVDEYFERDEELEPGTLVRVRGRIRDITSTFDFRQKKDQSIVSQISLYFERPNPVIGPTGLTVADRTELAGLHIEQEVTIESTIPEPVETRSGVFRERLGSKKESRPIWKILRRGEPMPAFSDPHVVHSKEEVLKQFETLTRFLSQFKLSKWDLDGRVLEVNDKLLDAQLLLPDEIAQAATDLRLFKQVRLDCQITSGLIKQVSRFRGVEKLSISPSDDKESIPFSLKDVDLAPLATMRDLHRVEFFGGDGLSPAHLDQVGRIPFLRFLDFGRCTFNEEVTITDDWLSAISQCQTLRWLNLPDGFDVKFALTEEGIRTLGNATHLTTLELKEIEITGACFDGFLECRQLHALELSDSAVTVSGLNALKEFSALRSLSVSSCENLDDSFGKLIADLSELERLTAINTNIGESFFAHCDQHPGLKYLDLSKTGLKQPNGQKLSGENWSKLKSLDVGNNETIRDDFGLLVHLPPSLKTLNVAGTSITDQIVIKIVKQHPQMIEELVFTDCMIGDEALKAIVNAPPPKLRSLILFDTNCSEAAIQMLLDSLPQLTRIGLPKENVKAETVSRWKEQFHGTSFY